MEEQRTIVASCFWLATFLILPMLTIKKTANHEEVQRFQERGLLEVEWGGRDDRLAEKARRCLMTFLVHLSCLTKNESAQRR